MKKTIFFVIVMIFAMSATFASDRKTQSDKPAIPVAKENKLSEAELNSLTNRVEEIRDMDRSNLTVKENRELKKELRKITKTIEKNGGTIVIGSATLLLIILLIIILL